MTSSLRTPAAQVRGLGASREGTGHYVRQRVTAVALVVLVPWFVWGGLGAAKGGYWAVLSWLSSPLNAIVLVLALAAAFYHMRLGMQVVIEDYIGKTGTKQVLLVLNTFLALGLFAAAGLSVLKIWFAAG